MAITVEYGDDRTTTYPDPMTWEVRDGTLYIAAKAGSWTEIYSSSHWKKIVQLPEPSTDDQLDKFS